MDSERARSPQAEEFSGGKECHKSCDLETERVQRDTVVIECICVGLQ
jgi:hypothetical protein